MGCIPIGGGGFACSRTGPKACSSCSVLTRRPKLCDFPLAGAKAGKTCDRALCDGCATSIGPNRDYCPAHARQSKTSGVAAPVLSSAAGGAPPASREAGAPEEPPTFIAIVAQSVEQPTCKAQARGSIPLDSSGSDDEGES